MKYWIAVASKDHVLKGIKGNFAQACHGKCSPLKSMSQGDWIIYYSPQELFGTKTALKKFTAIGIITHDEPYEYKMNDTFIPWRRNVNFLEAEDSPIQPLIPELSFIKNKQQWGFIFRFGLFTIPYTDFKLIAKTMGITIND